MVISLSQRLLVFISLFIGSTSYSFSSTMLKRWFNIPDKTTTKSSWPGCPSQTAGKFVLSLVKEFEDTQSLFKVNQKIKKNKLTTRYFVDEYNISYSPVKNRLIFNLRCPKALVRVSAINDDGKVVSSSVLVEGGKLFDPTYEMLLKSDKILKSELPTLAISYGRLTEQYKNLLTDFFANLDVKTKSMLSELIVDSSGKMTLILSHKRKPMSVFFGENSWIEKRKKLTRMIAYLLPKKGLPKTINMSNSKKVVVKF